MDELSLVLPMAGRGSRFGARGFGAPKPLIMLHDRPFFWWATESVRRAVPVRALVFVVLAEHVADHAIDRRIRDYYPDAQIVVLPEVTDGAAETARCGVEALGDDGPFLVNDCDHAFAAPDLAALPRAFAQGAGGSLLCFRSASPAYSYARFAADGSVVETVEKQVISDRAIAGCYGFASAAGFRAAYARYQRDCPYAELFVSGLYNGMIAAGERVIAVDVARHLSFGTPEEFAAAEPRFDGFLDWRGARGPA